MRLSVIFATLVLLSSLGYSQIVNTATPDSFQMGYATYLKNGDSSLILSNGGAQIGTTVFGVPTEGIICASIYVFDTREELNECCSCRVTPDGFRSFSARNDLTENPVTGIAPTNSIIKLVATIQNINGACDPTFNDYQQVSGLTAWGTTITPAPPAGKTYSVIPVIYKNEPLSLTEIDSLASTCLFADRLGSGKGICSCGVSGD